MQPFLSFLNFNEKRFILQILTEKLRRAIEGRDNFLLEVGNPVKLILLLVELVTLKLKLTHESNLRTEAKKTVALLIELARRVILLYKGENETRGLLTDIDLKGRDVVSLISLNHAVDLFEHKYIEKLADEAWDGPTRVNRSLLWLNTSWIALNSLF